MEPFLISREEYDRLIADHGPWMEREFIRYHRRWSLAGVTVNGSFSMLIEIAGKIREGKVA